MLGVGCWVRTEAHARGHVGRATSGRAARAAGVHLPVQLELRALGHGAVVEGDVVKLDEVGHHLEQTPAAAEEAFVLGVAGQKGEDGESASRCGLHGRPCGRGGRGPRVTVPVGQRVGGCLVSQYSERKI